MMRSIQNALRDLRANLFLNLVTLFTIALSVLIFSAFALFFINADRLVRKWIADIRILVYIADGVAEPDIETLKQKIAALDGVTDLTFIPRDAALAAFKQQLGTQQASLVENLAQNPLPDAFEVTISDADGGWRRIAPIAQKIAAMAGIDSVEYGQEWLERFIGIFNLFRISGYGLAVLFSLAVVFFIANTFRLVLYSRRDEIEIMRLVGASEGYIKDPFYLQSILLGIIGATAGLGALYGLFRVMMKNVAAQAGFSFFQIQFLPPRLMLVIALGSVLIGLAGCFISLRNFLK